jgi:hypothetical protein
MGHCNQPLAKKTRRKGVEHKDKKETKSNKQKGREEKPLRIKADDSSK